MTLVEHNLSRLITPTLQQTICLTWSSMRIGASRAQFVLALQFDGSERGSIEVWIENGHGREGVLRRQPCKLALLHDGDMLHIDAMSEPPATIRIATITLAARDGESAQQKLVYAQTPLLAKAGFSAGTYEPPAIRPVIPAQVGIQTAPRTNPGFPLSRA